MATVQKWSSDFWKLFLSNANEKFHVGQSRCLLLGPAKCIPAVLIAIEL